MLGLCGIEGDVDASGVFVFVENFLPGLAAVGGAEDTAFGVWSVGMAESGYENDFGIAGIDDDFADGAAVAQADVLPGLASVERLVDSVAVTDVAADAGFAGADINGIAIGIGYGEAADRTTTLFIEHWDPALGAVGGLPDSAAGGAEIVGGGIAGDSGCGERASAAEGADQAVLHAFEEFVFGLVGFVVGGLLVRGYGRRWRGLSGLGGL